MVPQKVLLPNSSPKSSPAQRIKSPAPASELAGGSIAVSPERQLINGCTLSSFSSFNTAMSLMSHMHFGEARQRTVDEYTKLFDSTHFSLTRVLPTGSAFSIVEARPV